MFGRALLPLLARPKPIALLALGMAATVMPVAILTLLESPGPDSSERAGMAIAMSGAPLWLLGCACGFAIRQAAWCSFAWTMPRFRRRLRIEFMASTLVLALATTVLVMVAFRPALGLFPIVLLTSVAGLTLGCAFATVPESPFLLLLLFLAPFVFRVRWVEAAIGRPLAFSAVAAAIAAIAVRATFATRTFRSAAALEIWSSLATWVKGRLATRNAKGRGPALHATAARPGAQSPPRLPYADTLVRRMIAMSRTTRPVAWLLLLAAGLLAGPVFAVYLRTIDPPSTVLFLVGRMFVGVLGFMHVLPPSQMLRSVLPWSRREHLVATWAWHAAMATWFALVACPSFVLLVRALGSSGWTMVDAAGMAGSALLLFPVSWRLLHRWFGQPQFVVQRSVLLLPLFQLGTPAIGALLAALVPAPPLRLTVLSVLVLSSQLVHWFLLKRDFATRDLAGAST